MIKYILILTLTILLLRCLWLTIYLKNRYIYYWYNSKPFKLQNIENLIQGHSAIELINLSEEATRICSNDILKMDVPPIYLIANKGLYLRKGLYGETRYHFFRKPDVYIYYDGENTIKTLAHELYHVYKNKEQHKRFSLNNRTLEKELNDEIEACAFSIAYIETKCPQLKIDSQDWDHELFSNIGGNVNYEKLVREKAELYKEMFNLNQKLE